jgi:hypothetical protein
LRHDRRSAVFCLQPIRIVSWQLWESAELHAVYSFLSLWDGWAQVHILVWKVLLVGGYSSLVRADWPSDVLDYHELGMSGDRTSSAKRCVFVGSCFLAYLLLKHLSTACGTAK